jgi:hypothetical protein
VQAMMYSNKHPSGLGLYPGEVAVQPVAECHGPDSYHPWAK